MLLQGKRTAEISAKLSRRLVSQAAGALFESLESRDLFATSPFSLSGTILTVKGSLTSRNTLSTYYNAAKTSVYVTLNGTTKTYSKSAVQKLIFTGGNLGDKISTSALLVAQSINTGGGYDTVTTGSGNDTVITGSGNDSIITGGGNDSIISGVGNDTVYAGSGNDSINGGENNDKLFGESGRDSLDGGTGTDTGNGGTESDVGANLETKTSIEGTIGTTTGGSTGSGGTTTGGNTGGTGGGIIDGTVNTDANAPKPTPRITVVSTSSLKAGQSAFVHGINSAVGAGSSITARYEWDFGDPSGNYNKLVGFNAAHQYNNPGTYTVTLRIINELRGVATTTTTINVAAAGRRTIYVSNDGSDSNDGSSPSRAISSWARAASLVSRQDNVEVLFNRGDLFQVKSLLLIAGDNVKVGSYGSGAKPLLKYSGARNTGQFIRIDYSARNTIVDGVTFDSIWNGVEFDHSGMPFCIKVDGDYNTVNDCTFLSVGFALQTNEHPDGVLVQNSDAPTTYGLRDYFVWGQGSDFVLLGNKVTNVINEHAVRIFGVERLLIAYGDYANHKYYSFEPNKNSLNLQEANYVEIYGVTVRDNFQVGPLGDGDGLPWKNARLNNVVIENCRTEGAKIRVVHGAQNVMIRNNILHVDNDSAINVDAYNASYGRGVANLNIINNTAVNTGIRGRFLYVGGDAAGISLVNNLYRADNILMGDNAAGGVYVNDNNLASFRVISNNVWPQPDVVFWINLHPAKRTVINIVGAALGDVDTYLTVGEWNNISPVGTDYQQNTNWDSRYAPSAGSFAAVNGAKYAGVFTDFYGNARPLNAAWSIGAVEV